METLAYKHWTSESVEDFTFRIASDFLAQVETKIEAGEVTRAELAQRLNRTAGRVSQLLNNPGNLTVSSAVRLVRAAGMKVALVAYDDKDPENNNGPVNSEIFNRCWEHMGAPKTFFEFAGIASEGNNFNTYSANGNGLTVGTYTTSSESCTSSLNGNHPVMTVTGNHDVNCYYPNLINFHGVIRYQGTTVGAVLDAVNTGSCIGMKEATTAMKTGQESIPSHA